MARREPEEEVSALPQKEHSKQKESRKDQNKKDRSEILGRFVGNSKRKRFKKELIYKSSRQGESRTFFFKRK
jgi:hypothetical protein